MTACDNCGATIEHDPVWNVWRNVDPASRRNDDGGSFCPAVNQDGGHVPAPAASYIEPTHSGLMAAFEPSDELKVWIHDRESTVPGGWSVHDGFLVYTTHYRTVAVPLHRIEQIEQ